MIIITVNGISIRIAVNGSNSNDSGVSVSWYQSMVSVSGTLIVISLRASKWTIERQGILIYRNKKRALKTVNNNLWQQSTVSGTLTMISLRTSKWMIDMVGYSDI